jgi:putative transposase
MDVIYEKQRPGRAPKFDEATRAKITALACTTPPEGYGQWSYRLLADKAVELGFVDAIHFDTVGEMLKKTSFNRNGSEVGA